MALHAFFERRYKTVLSFFVHEGCEDPRADVAGDFVNKGEVFHKRCIWGVDLNEVVPIILLDCHAIMPPESRELNGDDDFLGRAGSLLALRLLFFLLCHGFLNRIIDGSRLFQA